MENLPVTIVVPTYNERRFNVKRSSLYLTQYFNKIIIVDSSKSKYPYNLEDNRIRYIHCPELGYYEKLILAVEYVDTEYMAFCADDDFIIPKGVFSATKFLIDNPDYSMAIGRQVCFFKKSEKSPKYEWRLTDWEGTSIDEDTASKRLIGLLSSFKASTFYAVHRKELMRELLQGALENTSDYLMGEYIVASLAVIRGKFKITDDLYMARNAHPSNNPHNLYNFIMNGTFDEKYKIFKDYLSAEIKKVEEISTQEAEDVIDKAIQGYLQKEGLDLNRLKGLSRIKDILKKIGLLGISLRLKQGLFGRMDYGFKIDKLMSQPKNPFEEPQNKDFEEFTRISRFIEEFTE